ncbi:Diaminopimelate epimerase-like protein [Setomelanomma holmii]|uniref:trans-L-3-hydroxyproline dehydratase n=1 Tax=Setomelanomma holmii TaxID=210430 RepID=A0A9P4LH85_9PLEO|nr:Diaminopimelate epimerase-like protein [Setomelanomma holmii]
MSASVSLEPFWIDTEDWHTAGEPFRIVEHVPSRCLPEGETVAERRFNVLRASSHQLDVLRQSLCHEPRGHADMYGGFIVPPDDAGAHFGVLFWHKDGFSTACGHGTIALGYWAFGKGLVDVPNGDGEVDVVIDVPSGRVKATVAVRNGKPIHADFVNVKCHIVSNNANHPILKDYVNASVQLSYGGAEFACVNAKTLELPVEPANVQKFVELAGEIKAQFNEVGRESIASVIFWQEEGTGQTEDGELIIKEKNVVVYGDGQIDRSPCGSGTSARIAIHHANGLMHPGKGKFLNRSIIGTTFEGRIASSDLLTCCPVIRGSANLVGKMNFYVDPRDPVYPGFVLR